MRCKMADTSQNNSWVESYLEALVSNPNSAKGSASILKAVMRG